MRAYDTSRDRPNRRKQAFVAPSTSESRPARSPKPSTRPGRHHGMVPNTQKSPKLLANSDGLPGLVSRLVHDVLAELRSDGIANDADIDSRLSSALERMANRMRVSRLRHDDPSKRSFAVAEPAAGGDPLVRRPATSREQMTLRVAGLELDLIDRTAKRGERQINLRPREFLLLKYMMQRSDQLLTRAVLLQEVWHYKFVPETNLVDVHLGRLRRKVDGANETPLIRNIRGAGFVLSANLLSQGSPRRHAERSTTLPSATGLRNQSEGLCNAHQ
jgi:DNA-binding response OmpR family regulator